MNEMLVFAAEIREFVISLFIYIVPVSSPVKTVPKLRSPVITSLRIILPPFVALKVSLASLLPT